MAASTYYQLDRYPPSDPNALSDLYSGSDYNNQPVESSEPSLRPTYTANTYNDPPPLHPIVPPSRPLVHYINTSQPLKPSNTPNSRLRQRRYQNWKRALRILQILTKVLTIIFSTIMFGLMVFMVIKYNTTKGIIRDARNAWPKNAKLWPTFMLLAGSGLTLLLSLFTLLSYCIKFSAARRSWKLTVMKYTIHILSWVIISTLYRYEKSLHGVNNDLWGWSCADEANAIQTEFQGVVNFKALCGVQVSLLPQNEVSAYESTVEFLGGLNRRSRRQDSIRDRAFCDIQKDAR